MNENLQRGRTSKRIAVREIPCDACGNMFGQTAFEKSRNRKVCPACNVVHRAARNPLKKIKKTGPRTFLEIVLPRALNPRFDKRKGEWYMKVRVRKRGSDEPYLRDKIYLGVKGANANSDQVNAAFTATYARMEMNGASRFTAEAIKKKRKRIKTIVGDRKSWRQGKDRDLGVTRHVIQKVVFAVHLPDPKEDGKKHYFGRFENRAEARKARDAEYRKLKHEHVPCAVCGRMPAVRRGIVTHFAVDCPNQVQMPQGVRPLLQAKLWNLVFSTGEVKGAGKLTQEDLYYMGYMYKSAKGFRYYARNNVEFDFSLAKNYVRKRKSVVAEEEIGFE